ncbi:MAG TPA: 3-oxoacyl-ACP reductase FabG [Solirubrobacteraceae bacterium]|nr:3-oxoacyl-ACP reductase FabG [Solirubrobacteraceae bacterium]
MAEPGPKREGSALVTGASRGIGAAVARALARDGWRVGVNYRSDRSGAEAVVSDIERDGGEAVALAADVADPDAPDELFGALESRFDGPVLVLVNNAGISRDDLTPSLDDEEWNAVLETNLTAAFRLTRRALKAMLRARSGRIVNVSSAVALRANPGQANYAAAKAGLIALTKTSAVEVARRGVTVNAVAPGLIETDFIGGASKDIVQAIPARRIGTPEEVAACVRFLTSDEASYVTGAVLTVDGGLAA